MACGLEEGPTTQHFSPGCSSHSFFTKDSTAWDTKIMCSETRWPSPCPIEALAQSLTEHCGPGALVSTKRREHQMQGPLDLKDRPQEDRGTLDARCPCRRQTGREAA